MRRTRRSSTTLDRVGTLGDDPTVTATSAPAGAARRLARAQTLWLATVRPTGSPHLVPVWFVWLEGCFFICTEPGSVKARNLEANPGVVVALEDGLHPLICAGEGSAIPDLGRRTSSPRSAASTTGRSKTKRNTRGWCEFARRTGLPGKRGGEGKDGV